MTLGLVCGIMSHKLPLWLFPQLSEDRGARDVELGPLDHECGRAFSSSQPDAFLCQASVAVMHVLQAELGSKACCFFRKLQGCY